MKRKESRVKRYVNTRWRERYELASDTKSSQSGSLRRDLFGVWIVCQSGSSSSSSPMPMLFFEPVIENTPTQSAHTLRFTGIKTDRASTEHKENKKNDILKKFNS